MIRVRFACSPAGHLPLGAGRVALANLLFARRHGGEILLRLDDADTERYRPEFVEPTLQDLQWLGVEPSKTIRQSERLPLYAEAGERLKRAGRLYPCFESDEELRAKRDYRLKRGRSPVYDRAMLKLTSAQRESAEAGGKRPYWRFHLSDTTRQWRDAVLGQRAVKLQAVSDPVVLHADGTPTAVFASVVDDMALEISHVIRGEEHATNTGVHADIMAALGGNPDGVIFAHLPAVADDGGGRWSRRTAGRTLRSLRNDGIEAAALAVYLARLGTALPLDPSPLGALAQGFELGDLSPRPAPFMAAQLLAVNRAVLAQLEFPAVADRLPRGATEAFWLAVRGSLDLLNETRGWWDVVAGTIVPPVIEGGREILTTALKLLPPEPWNGSVCADWMRLLAQALARDPGDLSLPLRLALTGEDGGPDLAQLLPLIGRTRTLHRLQVAAA